MHVFHETPCTREFKNGSGKGGQWAFIKNSAQGNSGA